MSVPKTRPGRYMVELESGLLNAGRGGGGGGDTHSGPWL